MFLVNVNVDLWMCLVFVQLLKRKEVMDSFMMLKRPIGTTWITYVQIRHSDCGGTDRMLESSSALVRERRRDCFAVGFICFLFKVEGPMVSGAVAPFVVVDLDLWENSNSRGFDGGEGTSFFDRTPLFARSLPLCQPFGPCSLLASPLAKWP